VRALQHKDETRPDQTRQYPKKKPVPLRFRFPFGWVCLKLSSDSERQNVKIDLVAEQALAFQLYGYRESSFFLERFVDSLGSKVKPVKEDISSIGSQKKREEIGVRKWKKKRPFGSNLLLCTDREPTASRKLSFY